MVNQIPRESCYFGIRTTVLLYLTLSLQHFIIRQPSGGPYCPPHPPEPVNICQESPLFLACFAFRRGLMLLDFTVDINKQLSEILVSMFPFVILKGLGGGGG